MARLGAGASTYFFERADHRGCCLIRDMRSNRRGEGTPDDFKMVSSESGSGAASPAKRQNDRHVDRAHKQLRPRAKCGNGARFYKFTINLDELESRLMTSATMIVTCSGGTYFDRDYYVDVHLPLALASWQKHGLESAAAFFPRDVDGVDVSVGIYRFRDEAALHAALASAETDAVMADVPRFTDANVSRVIGAPL